MNKTIGNTSFVYGPQTHAKMCVYDAVAVIAFVAMLAALYAPEISTIGEGIRLDYNLVP